MRYGMNLLLWTDDPLRDDPLALCERLRDMGFDGVEIPIFGGEPAAYARLGARLDDLGLARTAITVCAADADPISADPVVRAAAGASLRRVLDCSQALGAELLCGPLAAGLGVFSGTAPSEAERERAVTHLRTGAAYAERCAVTLAVEYLNRFELYLINDAVSAAALVRRVDHPRCRLMYDSFHAHIEEKSVSSAVAACGDLLAHVHVSENDRSTPGAGQVDWRTTFDALHEVGYAGWLVIEAFGQALPALAAATRIWRPMFAEAEELARAGLAFMRSEWERRACPA